MEEFKFLPSSFVFSYLHQISFPKNDKKDICVILAFISELVSQFMSLFNIFSIM